MSYSYFRRNGANKQHSHDLSCAIKEKMAKWIMKPLKLREYQLTVSLTDSLVSVKVLLELSRP